MNDSGHNAILCPRCGKLISRDERSCPYCGMTFPGGFLFNNPMARLFYDPAMLINSIVALNIVLFIITLIIKPHVGGLTLNPLRFLAPDIEILKLTGASGTIPIDQLWLPFEPFGRWWTLLSANYLHGGLLHIFFNMMALRTIAPLIANTFGARRMFTIYTLSGICGFLVSYLAGIPLTIGASAAICGLIGAALYYGRSRGGVFGQVIFQQVRGWVFGLFLIGLIPGINNWGHGGGLIAGIALGYGLGYLERKPENMSDLLMAMACMTATLAVLLWAVGVSVFLKIAG